MHRGIYQRIQRLEDASAQKKHPGFALIFRRKGEDLAAFTQRIADAKAAGLGYAAMNIRGDFSASSRTKRLTIDGLT